MIHIKFEIIFVYIYLKESQIILENPPYIRNVSMYGGSALLGTMFAEVRSYIATLTE